MTCQPSDLKSTMNEFRGGSEQRYRHALNRGMIYTEGMKAVAEKAGAYWLLDLIATQIAPVYAIAWLKGDTGVGLVTLQVPASGAATVTLSLGDDTPPALTVEIPSTTFPEGEWKFFLGTDQLGPEKYIWTLMIPEEY